MPVPEDFEHQEPIPAIEQTIKLGAGVSIDGYLLSMHGSWDIRYGLNYISLLLGYAEDYFLRLSKKNRKKSKALRDKGYTDVQIPVKLLRERKRGSTIAHTICFDDFCLVVEHEAKIGNAKALALLTASFRELLRSRTQVAFGLPEDTLEQKQVAFGSAYLTYLQYEQILAENRAEVEELILPGDEGLGYDLLDNVLYYPEFLDWDTA